MLVGWTGSERIDAAAALRGTSYFCPSPECGGALILKKGRKVAAHFAHKPPFNCTWAHGETLAHMLAKAAFCNAALRRGLRAELEHNVGFLQAVDRRADVMVWSPSGRMVAVEIQHTNISIADIEARAFSYAAHGVAQLWVPVAKRDFWKNAKPVSDGVWKIEKYAPHEFEKWISGLNMGREYWIFDPETGQILIATLKVHRLFREGSRFYQEADEVFNDSYYHRSKRFRELIVQGPFELDRFRIKLTARKSFARGACKWPSGYIAQLVLEERV
jgi:hypothetical protein